MDIKTIPVGIYNANCYLLIDQDKCAIIDPGGDPEDIIKIIEDNNLIPKFILLTHGHIDHVGGVEAIKDEYNIPFYINRKDEDLIKEAEYIFGNFGKYKNADEYLVEGKEFQLGNLKIKAIETPGHSPGGMSFLVNNVIFTGDTLFRESIGRSDFIGGSHNTLINSIQSKITVLDPDIYVLPGHGPQSTIGYEKNNNPFF
ncbi:MBL fold metallo-hydrolase [Clostridium botulinum]|uniref:Metallo-beta-lactamase family protein n=2 Tax=Clostridium botulinum TaxID=1491 RepID=A7GHS5_CLOBL|nr:MBL fold metallo-hydrolase [Clostridium botulinum]EKX79008.1 metallo-beta-lactamase family protein [Clostridium botulinum CFSAN001628]ABS40966.1 metallo-beta-lactamase family protein [Clostridium botulinum F str. Langeland]ACA44734.1 metallo-beta-lactamase family protein [Clostridium botulinum B1 str. Okra]ADG00705.1 metallo-beta-lactamase family protein [Clostridium botulinum F str. 230613]KKM40790.1 beta-lactamase [Clostridium botulinum]